MLDMLSAVEDPQSPHRPMLIDYMRRTKVWIAETFGDNDPEYKQLIEFSVYLRLP
jgi:hypothetical protein